MNNMMPMGLDPNADRDPNIMPTQSPFMKYVSSSPVRKSYAAPLNRELKGNQDKLPQHLQEAIKDAPPFNRKMKYCGGTSKPYGRKK